MKTIYRVVCSILLFSASAIAQTTPDFDLEAYKAFLASHQDLSSSQLLSLHSAGKFAKDAPTQASAAAEFARIDAMYTLTADEKALLERHGFVVTERLQPTSFGAEFLKIYQADLPVFVSTDAILHGLHMSYDLILRTTEEQIMIPSLGTALTQLHAQMPTLANRYQNTPAMGPALADLDLYLVVARRLLGQTVTPFYLSTSASSDLILQYIAAASWKKGAAPLFDDSIRYVDYSQFTPRGHYTLTKQLTQYFQAMMWLGRTEFYLSPPKNTEEKYTDAQIQRQAVATLLLLEAVDLSGASGALKEIDDILKFFVGESDNVTSNCLKGLNATLGVQQASELLDTTRFKSYQAALLQNGWAYQRILSQMLTSGGVLATDQIQPASSFLLMGQRFVIDSYVTGNVVYDKIIYQNAQVKRMLPSTLDVLFALGNDASAQLLVQELERYHYATNLAALRYLIDAYEPQFWQNTFYNGWLNAIRELNPQENRTALPRFMQTAAWWQEKMNTQLASWAQLRHDNLLYAKQSYTGIPICSFPYSYVEPIPGFYRGVARLADTAAGWFRLPSMSKLGYVSSYFTGVKNIADTLAGIAEKELAGTGITELEQSFLRRMMYPDVGGCAPTPTGWYPQLFFSMGSATDENLVVADVHTSPADEGGAIVGWVLHGGTGPLNMAFVVTEISGVGPVAFAGPVMSYHEYVSSNFKRLTDEEWKSQYVGVLSSRPSWINLYLADQSGKMRTSGLTLLTDIQIDPVGPKLPPTLVMAQNYPNPFNSSTIIPVFIPQNHMLGQTEIAVYDIQGRRVRQLLNAPLPAGSYLVRWDGKSDDGHSVASGVYVSILKSQGSMQTRKMVLIR